MTATAMQESLVLPGMPDQGIAERIFATSPDYVIPVSRNNIIDFYFSSSIDFELLKKLKLILVLYIFYFI